MEQLSLAEAGLSLRCARAAGAQPGARTAPDFGAASRHVLLGTVPLEAGLSTRILI